MMLSRNLDNNSESQYAYSHVFVLRYYSKLLSEFPEKFINYSVLIHLAKLYEDKNISTQFLVA
jgi:hypothetical protein